MFIEPHSNLTEEPLENNKGSIFKCFSTASFFGWISIRNESDTGVTGHVVGNLDFLGAKTVANLQNTGNVHDRLFCPLNRALKISILIWVLNTAALTWDFLQNLIHNPDPSDKLRNSADLTGKKGVSQGGLAWQTYKNKSPMQLQSLEITDRHCIFSSISSVKYKRGELWTSGWALHCILSGSTERSGFLFPNLNITVLGTHRKCSSPFDPALKRADWEDSRGVSGIITPFNWSTSQISSRIR